MAHEQHRISTFDLLRGTAVLTMILAHSVYFFHSRESAFLLSVEGFGNTVSFVTFLLVSGAVAAVAYFKEGKSATAGKRRRILQRVILLLLAYYLLALILTAVDLFRAEGFARIQLVLDILSFRYLPGFTEYFPPFIFYSALLALLPRWFFARQQNLKNVSIVSLAALLAGFVLSELPASPWQPWLALLAGAEGFFRFPLLQYLPVFLLGLYWGRATLALEGLEKKRLLCSHFFWFFALIAMGAFLWSYSAGLSFETTFSRWPPSVPFLALGLSFAFFLASVFYALHQLQRVALLRHALLTLGQNALGMFWSHVFLLGIYAIAGGPKVSSEIVFVFFFFLLLLLSLALTTFLPFNFRLALTLIRKSHEEREETLEKESVFRLSEDVAADAAGATRGLQNFLFPNPHTMSRRALRKRHRLVLSFVLVAVVALLFPPTIEEVALRRQQRLADIWWSDSYAYRQQVTLSNADPFVAIASGTPVAIRFDHQRLVDEEKSRTDGADVQLVYWDGSNHLVMESVIENTETADARLIFRTPVRLQGKRAEPFFALYYSGIVAPHVKETTIEATANVLATFEDEEAFPLLARVSKTWNLLGDPSGGTLTFSVSSTRARSDAVVTYKVLDTDLAGTMHPSDETSWEATVPIDTLPPGAYRIQASVREGERESTSHVSGFYRSYPLYVAWTMDWEGYDVNRGYLDAIEAIADEYRTPMTHFFNPRIYITDTVPTERAQAITQWVQRRLAMGDGFGLHLHMFTDFVEAAGVEPRKEPNWGDRGDDYGVPMSAYAKDEQVQMIEKAMELLKKNGFPSPDIFRAGGWYANLDTLAALEDLGFIADSSARTKYAFGRNELPGHWNISPTMAPYRPSRTNQNATSPTRPFALLEIPNNGADSYAYSAEAMIDRFTMNVQNGILNDKQQVTYLSHPHWFDENEQARVRELFSYIRHVTFSHDQGPVIFTTTEAIADLWLHNE